MLVPLFNITNYIVNDPIFWMKKRKPPIALWIKSDQLGKFFDVLWSSPAAASDDAGTILEA
jgi:hypothetical protein